MLRQALGIMALPRQGRKLELYSEEGDKELALGSRFLDVQGKARETGFTVQGASRRDYDRPHLWVGASLTDGRPAHSVPRGAFASIASAVQNSSSC